MDFIQSFKPTAHRCGPSKLLLLANNTELKSFDYIQLVYYGFIYIVIKVASYHIDITFKTQLIGIFKQHFYKATHEYTYIPTANVLTPVQNT